MSGIERQLQSMVVGETRWVGREDWHVYCFGTKTRGGYDATVKSYKVVTVRRPFEGQPWVTAAEAAKVLSRLGAEK
jgi:hypothetical protein